MAISLSRNVSWRLVALLTALGLATLLRFRPSLFGSNLGISLVIAFVFFLPGFFVFGTLFRSDSGFRPVELPTYFVYSLAVWTVPAGLVRLCASDWETFLNTFLAILWILALIYFLRTRSAGSPPRGGLARELASGVVLFALCIFVALVVYRGPRENDDWGYINLVQQMLHSDGGLASTGQARLDLRLSLHVWLFLQAFVADWLQLDPIRLVRDILPIVSAPLSILALYTWAREFTGSRRAGLITVLAQLLIYLSFFTYQGWGFGFFARSTQDKFLAWLVILPVALRFFFRFLSRGARADWLALGLSLAAIVSVHVIGLAQFFLTVSGFAFFNLLSRARVAGTRWVAVALWIAPAALVGLLFRLLSNADLFSLDTAAASAYFNISDHRLVFLSLGSYIAHPDLIAHPIILLAVGLAPLLLSRWREDVRAQFLLAGTLIPLALLYNPVTAWLVGQAIMPWEIWRMTWVIPAGLALAYLATRREFFASSQRWQTAALLIGIVIVASLTLSNLDISGSLRTLGQSHQLNPQTEEFMRALPRYVSKRSLMLFPSELSVLAPAFSVNAFPLYRGYPTPEGPLGSQIDRFYTRQQSPRDRIAFLNHWGIDFVIVQTDSPLNTEIQLAPQFLAPRHANTAYSLYEIVQKPIPSELAVQSR